MTKTLSFASRTLIAISMFCNLLTYAHAQQPVFYFAAHEDDWQLFMAAQAFSDSTLGPTGVKMVFVTLTAGDAGCGSGCPGTTSNQTPYYLARENGSIATVKFLGDYQTTASGQIGDVTRGTATIRGHAVHKIIYRNMVAYFFRLPDGNPSGTGYSTTGNQSLQNSRTCVTSPSSCTVSMLSAVDGSTTYTDWHDLTATIESLVINETGNASHAWLNLPNTNQSFNPNDHSDHYYTSYAAQDAMTGIAQYGFNGFMDYNTANESSNLSTDQVENKAALFGTINYELFLNGAFSTWEPTHKSWLSREYSQIMRSPVF